MIKSTYTYIDLNSLRENTYGNVPVERQIMHLFIDMVDEYITTLEKELPKKNWKELYDATHKIKPNISMFGIYSMESTIVEIETRFRKEENLEGIEETINEVKGVFKEVKKELQIELNLLGND
ncbi:MAG: Hpt domain-containing protein [Flavobacteriales bacterium]